MLKVEQKAGDQAVKTLEYTYATNGFVKTMKYPSGLVVTQEQSGAGRTTSVVGSNGVTYAGGVTYGAGGMMTSALLNGTGASSLLEKRQYNTLGQMTSQDLLKGGVETGRQWKVTNDYGTSSNNGNLLKQWTETGSATYGVKFAYDAANRIRGAAENAPGEGSLETSPCSSVGGTWCVKYQVDSFGNAWTENKSGTAGGLLPSSSSWFTASNRLNNVAYYANGNQKQWVVNDALSRAEFDAEGRMVKAGRTLTAGGTDWDVSQPVVTMTYNGLGQRVKKLVQQSGVADAVTYWAYGLDGEMVAEWESGSVMSGRQFLVSDQLGSTRLRLDAGGEVVQRLDYEPYGGEVERSGVSGYGGGNEVKHKYTGKERDSETGLDYFLARYMSSVQGRFTSPDPLGSSGYPQYPGSWNRYAYVHNRINAFVDPDGLDIVPVAINMGGNRSAVAFIDDSIKEDFNSFSADVNSNGSTISYNYLFRSTSEQEALYDRRAQNSNPVAKPGTSPHESGLAFDFNRGSILRAGYDLTDLREDAAKYGFEPIVGGGDPPHLQARIVNQARFNPWAKKRVNYLRRRNQSLFSSYSRMGSALFGKDWASATTTVEADRRVTLLSTFYYLYLARLTEERFGAESKITC